MASPSKRRDTDLMKLMMSDFAVHIPDESSMHDFIVAFPGPADTPYEHGTWKVHVTLPKEYPYKSPSIGFENRIFHPNVDEMSGSVCLDVINQTWSPMFDLVNIFTMFLPQLLSYPNPTDPLNGEAAALMLRDPPAYKARIRESVRLHASTAVDFEGGCSSSTTSSGRRSRARTQSSDAGMGISVNVGSGSAMKAVGSGSSDGSGSSWGSPSTASLSGHSSRDDEVDMDDAASDVSEMSDLGI